ncbi:HupE/UreJ family protein [Parahaliea sp. F7430]|uniref:HupE/UreJ family protein n=1 Tax=Sediminihaliea albiluteola TaxID=2758564 RepID=A0A7W2YIE1_9GAMM|nr:HupE/UreJ family protein [Sediminihaliea albiluteola]MBA6411965.1 HupE/UreJ family protein [Sediminihaliea albiluteola]
MTALRRLSFLLLFLCLALPAQAHRFAPSLLKVTEIDSTHYSLVWKTPIQAASTVPMRPTWPASCDVISASPAQDEGTGRVISWRLSCPDLGGDGLVGHRLGVEGLEPNQASAMVMVTLRDGRHYQQVLNGEKPSFVIPAEPGSVQVMSDYIVLGVEHIWGGVDHLMFVFGLLLLVGSGMPLFWTVTAFTLGHSITLSLVTFGLFDYPVALVEFSIALSIFVLALELTREHGLVRRYPWWLAAGFGLLHGMGFAGALAETGLPQANVPLALLFFNLGIEIGQIAFILLVLLIWIFIRRPLGPQWSRKLVPVPVYLLGSLSAMWCIQRGLEVLS